MDIKSTAAVTEVLDDVVFFVANTIGDDEGSGAAAVVGNSGDGEEIREPDEVVQAEAGMEFAVVWETTRSDVELDIDIDFGEGRDPFLFVVAAAENVEDSDDPGTFVFMHSFVVDLEYQVNSDEEEEEDEDEDVLEARLEYTFSGGIDYEYVILFVYGEPGGDNVIMVNDPSIPPEEPSSVTSSEAFAGRNTQ